MNCLEQSDKLCDHGNLYLQTKALVTETEIISGCQKNVVECQRMLFLRYSKILMTICLRYASSVPDAEDMLQESFVRIFSSVRQYSFKGSFEGWLRTVTVNSCLRKLEKSKFSCDDTSAIENLADTIIPHAISALSEKELIKLISSLPDGYRIVFNLSAIEGYSHEEIANLLNIEPVTSRSQLAKARKLLQRKILAHQKINLPHER